MRPSHRLRTALAVVLGTFLSGCLSQMPAQEGSPSFGIRWEDSFESALREARGSGRPILLVLAAGDLRDKS